MVRYELDFRRRQAVFHHPSGVVSYMPFCTLRHTPADELLGPGWWPHNRDMAVAAVVAKDELIDTSPLENRC